MMAVCRIRSSCRICAVEEKCRASVLRARVWPAKVFPLPDFRYASVCYIDPGPEQLKGDIRVSASTGGFLTLNGFVFSRRHSEEFFEFSTEILGVIEAGIVCYFRYIEI